MSKTMKLIIAATGLYVAGCTSSGTDSGSTATVTATKPSTVVSELSTKIDEVSTNMGAAMDGVSPSSIHIMSSVDTKCNQHGEPLFQPLKTTEGDCNAASGSWDSGSCRMPSSDASYTGMKFYCFIAKDTGSPDSLQGAFGMFGKISCELEKQGVQWDGVERAMTVTMSEGGGCFATGELSDGPCEGETSCTMDMNVTASSLTGGYYDTSLDLEIGSMYYRAKVKVSDGITELAVSNNGQGVADDEDVYSVKLDETNMKFAYEGRFDRIDAQGCGSSCGWSRHFRVLVDLLDGSSEIIPESIEGAISDIYKMADLDNDSNNGLTPGYYTSLSTLKGSMTSGTGLTGIQYSSSEEVLADAVNATNLTAGTATCFQLGDDPAAGACAGNAGITKGTGVIAFFLPGGSFKSQTTAADKYLDGDVWFANLVGINFTSVGLSAE